MPVMPQFARNLKQLREESNLTQTQLADKIGVSRGSVSFYENGDRIPDIEVLASIANEFHVSTDWLLGRTEARSADAQTRQVCDYTGLSEDAIKWLRYFSKSDYIGDTLVMTFLNDLIGSPLVRFRDQGWRYAMARIQSDKAPKEPETLEAVREKRSMYDKNLFVEAVKPMGEASERVEISVQDAMVLYRTRATNIVSNMAQSELNAFYKVVCTYMDGDLEGSDDDATQE